MDLLRAGPLCITLLAGASRRASGFRIRIFTVVFAAFRRGSPQRKVATIWGMADDPTKRGPRDRSRINIHEDYELRYWAEEHFRVSKQDIIDAVTAVGPMVHDVEAELRRSGKIR